MHIIQLSFSIFTRLYNHQPLNSRTFPSLQKEIPCLPIPLFISLFFFLTFIYFIIYLFGCVGSQLWHVGLFQLQHVESSSLTRDQTRAPSIGSAESQPLDHQGSPLYLLASMYFLSLWICLFQTFYINRIMWPLRLASLTQHVFKIHPCCSMYHHFIPFYG